MPVPWPTSPPDATDLAAFADAQVRAFWLDRLPARDVGEPLAGEVEADLCIIGGGFTGLWAALHAITDDPGRDIVLLEGETVAFGASGRNGGFALASLTHGLAHGLARFGDEIDLLELLGRENFTGLVADVERHGIDCDLELTGDLVPSVAEYQDAWIAPAASLHRRFGYDVEVFEDAGAEVASPLYRSGLWVKDSGGVLDPAKLAVGVLEAVRRAGVRVFERTPATGLDGTRVITPHGSVRARRVVAGTSAYPPLVRSLRRYVVPVYDYALVTEPLSPEQMSSIGWARRQGIGDMGNRFHYYRLTDDNRILWGGFDAVYRYGGPVRPELDDHPRSFGRLAQNFHTTFPQLRGIRFTHRWGGAIDTCSRFSVFFGTQSEGRLAYAAGYTGLGVAATRFGARVALDLVDGRSTEATRSRFVARRPVPFPPEPLRSAVIRITQNRMAAADRRDGRRGLWLGLLDRLHLGFDS